MFDERLSEVLCETAEQMFFQEFADSQRDVPANVLWATIAVTSPDRFELIVAAEEEEICSQVGMIFMEDSPTLARVQDVVAELANTIAGSLARHLNDDAQVELAPPERGLGQPPQADLYHAFEGDDLTLFVAVRPLEAAA